MLGEAIKDVLGKPNVAAHGYEVHPTTKFPALDIEAISNDLGLDEAAVLRGRQNLPQSDADMLDESERSIIKYVERARKSATEGYSAEMRAYESRLAGLSFHSRASEMSIEARKALSSFSTEIQHAIVELTQLRDERLRAEADLNGFREKNRLRREASLPKTKWYVSFGLLGFILALETYFNGTFFAERVEGGISQGFMEAIGFALPNVICGYLLGRYAVPNLIHVSGTRRMIGVVMFLLFVGAILFVNFLAAHYRSVLLTDIDIEQATFRAWQNFLSVPLGIADLKSWLLMGIGLLAAGLSALKGCFMDDPYPDYGNRTRVYQKAVDSFIATKKFKMTTITAACDAATTSMCASMRSIEGALAEFRTVLDSRRKFHAAFVSSLNDLETAVNDLLTTYRQKNTEARTAPAPAHFRRPYELVRPDVAAPPSEDGNVAEMTSLVRQISADLERHQAAVHDAHDTAISQLAEIA